MAERPTYVVDASVVVRWHLVNPPYLEQARQVLDDYRSQQIDLSAPDNLLVEVSGAIHRAVLARSIRAVQGEQMVQDLFNLEIPTAQTPELVRPAYRLSIRLGCSFYDAIYLALSQQEDIPFVHADQRLRNALGERFPLAIWIEDYEPAR